MSVRHFVYLGVAAVMVGGCLPFLHPGAVDRSIDGSYDQVFQATLETLEARGFPIDRVDRDEGRIETGKRPVDGIDPYHPVETVEARIRDDEEVSVRLYLTFLTREPDPGVGTKGEWTEETTLEKATEQAVDRGAIYDEYLDAIEEQVREFRGLADS